MARTETRSETTLLEARGLMKSFGGRRVVDGVRFQVGAGEIVGLSVRTARARPRASA
jgi:ABC-type sugar transport system ATPase subunit